MGMWDADPYRRLAEDMGPVGKGIYWDVFEQIRLARGIDSKEHLLTIYDGVRNYRQRESLRQKLELILSPNYGLFRENAQGMMEIVDHTRTIIEQNQREMKNNEPKEMSLFDDHVMVPKDRLEELERIYKDYEAMQQDRA